MKAARNELEVAVLCMQLFNEKINLRIAAPNVATPRDTNNEEDFKKH